MFKGLRKGMSDIFMNQHLQTICVWKIFVPFLLIILIYPIFLVVVRVHHPFERAFAHGELLIFSALILIEAAVELKRARLGYDELLRAGAMLTIFIFGFMKYEAIQQERHLETQNADAINQLFAFSFFNCAVATFAITVSIFAFLQAVRTENDDRIAHLEQR
jgi:amino acid permease